jgi:hypothetical protein
MLSDGSPRLIVDPSMELFIEGALGGYVFKEVQNNRGKVQPKPEKQTRFSEIMDAGQYLVAPYELARQKGGRRQWPGSEDTREERRQEREKAIVGNFNPHTLFAR